MEFEAERYILEEHLAPEELSEVETELRGIEYDRICGFNEYMKDLFARVTCSICILIPYEPLECKNCNAVVCKQCIHKWQRTECIMRCGGKVYDSPSRILRDILNSISIFCKNRESGCSVEGKIEVVKVHEEDCEFEVISCKFEGCEVKDVRKKIKAHLEICEFNKVYCKYCSNYFVKCKYEDHLSKECLEFPVECKKCNKRVKRKDTANHDCVLSLKEENSHLNHKISNLINTLESVRIEQEDQLRQHKEELKKMAEKETLLKLHGKLLSSGYDDEDLDSRPFNLYNPMQVPLIFRFMTSSRSLQITNLAENTFSKLNLNIDFDIPTSHQSIVTSSKRVFIVGGVNHENNTYEFDILGKTLVKKDDMKFGRRRHNLTEIRKGLIIATGGSNQRDEMLSECEAYSISKNKWYKIAPMNYPRFYHTAFAFNNTCLYVAGGCQTGSSTYQHLNQIEKIKLDQDLTGSWEVLKVKDINLLKSRGRLSYMFLGAEKVLLFGGIPNYQSVFFDLAKEEIFSADSQFFIEGSFFFNDRCTWKDETLFISSQSSRCIFNHSTNTWGSKNFSEDNS